MQPGQRSVPAELVETENIPLSTRLVTAELINLAATAEVYAPSDKLIYTGDRVTPDSDSRVTLGITGDNERGTTQPEM